jgi:hypothetical protein
MVISNGPQVVIVGDRSGKADSAFMRPRRAFLAATAALLVAAGGIAREPGAVEASAPPSHAVVVELFTAQGCSSCPPADQLLTELGEQSGAAVVLLAFHVDFWNHSGWTDPFSSEEWTRRQVAYARKLGLQQVYTPQAVVDGGVELIGSRAAELRAAVSRAAALPAATIALDLAPSASKVRVEADVALPEALRDRSWDVMIAVYETGLVTPVARGENGGRTLRNDYVVRGLRRAGRVEKASRQTATLPLEKGWNRDRLGVAAFLQDPSSLEIRGATARPLPAR